MPQICKPCIHPRREDLDAELARVWRRSLRAIGAEYGLSKDALFRHARRHLPQDFIEAVREIEWEAAVLKAGHGNKPIDGAAAAK
jgi:hypothetical protein